ncbi:hypothetical protein HYH03_008036 [Edaphochlamys debaryana]|uniref:Thiol-disulfide oxidoreductase DCC n=1 Tax=Edaphochlamys debaryana TaxID=47281 RepID=A0A835XZD1_9CHLO|nr:hypothetical protein HYH03_008036 [Edaphochlamys debaryana]|eukprot:KAG2493817.1 hypothetical protein HYH03_008036 [Edaphochlamys debaryana]
MHALGVLQTPRGSPVARQGARATPAPLRPVATKRSNAAPGGAHSAAGSSSLVLRAAASAGPTSSSAPVQAPNTVVDDFATDQRPVILFDGVCNLCNGGVNFMLQADPTGIYRIAALQSPAGRRLLARCGRSPDDISSIVLVERDRCHIRSEAILRIGAGLAMPLPALAALGFPFPLPFRDGVYDLVANNRYSFFGRTDVCRLQDKGKFEARFIVN